MITGIEYESILKNKENYILIDTRCPREYAEATIPGAVNIPLFEDHQHEAIGICYKNVGKEESVRLGIGYISERLPWIYEQIMQIRQDRKKLALFCARGGMRSSSIGSLLQSLGVPVVKIDKGYKGYRQFLNNALPEIVEEFTFIPIYGRTGSGKTYILDEIAKLGYPVLDLEKCANHRGSLLGGIGLGACNSQKMFESLVFDSLCNVYKPYVFTEGESKRIGKIIMPEYLYDAVIGGEKILINTNTAKRVENIRREYITEDTQTDEIVAAIMSMEPYLGAQRAEEYSAMVREGRYDEVIETLMVKYYDSAYSTKNKEFICEFENEDEAETAEALIAFAEDKYGGHGAGDDDCDSMEYEAPEK